MAEFLRYILSVLCLSLSFIFSSSLRGETVGRDVAKDNMVASMLGVDVRPSYAFSSYLDDVLRENLSMDNCATTHIATSLHFKYGFSYDGSSEVARLFPGVWQGIGAGVNLMDRSRSTGVPVSLYLFQTAPIVNFSSRLSLDYEWNFGASVGWKPCNGVVAASNLIVGSSVNAYINLALGLKWKLSRTLSLSAALDLTHFSNGNTSFPNPGVNLAGIRLGISRVFGEQTDATPFRSDATFRSYTLSYDLTGYGAWRKRVYRGGENPVLLPGHFAVAGMNFAPMWDIRRYFRAGVSADFQWDESTGLRHYHISGDTPDGIRFADPPFLTQVSMGVSARAELVMPIFSVNVGIGYNFIGPEESRATYQMANLKVYITRSMYLNVGYQLQNFQRQNNLMLGLGYTFRSNRSRCTSLTGR